MLIQVLTTNTNHSIYSSIGLANWMDMNLNLNGWIKKIYSVNSFEWESKVFFPEEFKVLFF